MTNPLPIFNMQVLLNLLPKVKQNFKLKRNIFVETFADSLQIRGEAITFVILIKFHYLTSDIGVISIIFNRVQMWIPKI